MSEKFTQGLTMLYCYALEDQHCPQEIDLHLSDLKQQCQIVSRFDGTLVPGPNQQERMVALLSEMDLVLLLVSPHFHKVAAFWDEVSHKAWAVQWLGGCRVIALLAEPVNGNHAPYACREFLPRTGAPVMEQRPEPVTFSEVFPPDLKPLTAWQDQELAFQGIKQSMRLSVERQWLARGDYLRDEGGGVLDQEALAAYNEALRLNPLVKQVWYGKAYVLHRLSRYEEALHASHEAIQLDPDFSWAWSAMGNALVGVERYEEALQAYEEALLRDSASSEIWYRKAQTLKALKRRKDADEAMKRARQLGYPLYVPLSIFL